jgi:hypothetical protein
LGHKKPPALGARGTTAASVERLGAPAISFEIEARDAAGVVGTDGFKKKSSVTFAERMKMSLSGNVARTDRIGSPVVAYLDVVSSSNFICSLDFSKTNKVSREFLMISRCTLHPVTLV